MYTHTYWFLLGICFKSPYKAFRRYPIALRSKPPFLWCRWARRKRWCQASRHHPWYTWSALAKEKEWSSTIFKPFCFGGSILAFGLVSVEGLGDGWRCLDGWLSVSLENTRWRWLFVFRLWPGTHLLQAKLKFHDLRFWKASCFGCSIHPKAHPNKCPKRKQRSTKSSTSCDLLWIYMNCKAQGNLRSLQKLQAGCAQSQFGCCFSPRSWILLQCTNFDEHLLQLFS